MDCDAVRASRVLEEGVGDVVVAFCRPVEEAECGFGVGRGSEFQKDVLKRGVV